MTETERKIAEIIRETWENEAQDDNDQIEIYVSYITAYGYKPLEVIDFANKYGIIYDPDISDPDDEYDDNYGALIINSDTITDLT